MCAASATAHLIAADTWACAWERGRSGGRRVVSSPATCPNERVRLLFRQPYSRDPSQSPPEVPGTQTPGTGGNPADGKGNEADLHPFMSPALTHTVMTRKVMRAHHTHISARSSLLTPLVK